ncbi:MAG: hypothetical protein E3K37_00465 [Candidatus Kuenenia sp.]|nr:hypothetical protein [Candidatus Kuenenia hertensis]
MKKYTPELETDRYAKCIQSSKSVRWDIDKDIIRGREFDFSQKFLPDGISKVYQLDFLSDDEKKLLSQIQGRTYANMFGFVERFITAKILEFTHDHWMGDQTALEALVRFSDEELKHQELFRRIDKMMACGMPEGYCFVPKPNEVAAVVLGKSTWAVLALIYEIELFTQAHYKQSIEPDENLSDLYKDVFFFHWKEECQHALIDELEWPREDSKLTPEERDKAVDELIELIVAVDGILKVQSDADTAYFLKICKRTFSQETIQRIKTNLLKAYRWQYIFSGIEHPRFKKILEEITTETHRQNIIKALMKIR